MGRTKKVDRETAQASALSAFWVHGYSGLGVRKLEELTGINRFALQTEYGGKNGLFAAVLDTYASHWDRCYLEPVRKGNLEDLADYFLLRVSLEAREETNKGCLVINTLGEGHLDAPEINNKISKFMAHMQSAFTDALANEKAQGRLDETLDISEAAQMLLSALIGMNMLIRLKGSNEAALPTAKSLHQTIMNWRIAE